jgi:hypothetical protein
MLLLLEDARSGHGSLPHNIFGTGLNREVSVKGLFTQALYIAFVKFSFLVELGHE